MVAKDLLKRLYAMESVCMIHPSLLSGVMTFRKPCSLLHNDFEYRAYTYNRIEGIDQLTYISSHDTYAAAHRAWVEYKVSAGLAKAARQLADGILDLDDYEYIEQLLEDLMVKAQSMTDVLLTDGPVPDENFE